MHLQITSDSDDGSTCTGGMGGRGMEGDKVRAHASLCTQPHTASGASIQWGAKGLGKFACYIEGSLYWKPTFHKFLAKQAKCSFYWGMVND